MSRDSFMFAIVLAAVVIATVLTAADPSVAGVISMAVCWCAIGYLIVGVTK